MNKMASKNFSWKELQCKCGCKTAYISTQALIKLQRFRNLVGRSVVVNSVCRCPLHNARVGGVPNSKHRSTILNPSSAFDVSLEGHNKDFLIACAIKAGFKGIGINYKTFIHIDDRARLARW